MNKNNVWAHTAYQYVVEIIAIALNIIFKLLAHRIHILLTPQTASWQCNW
jgi:hypothetical protein